MSKELESIDSQVLDEYDNDEKALVRFNRRYQIPGYIAAICLFGGFFLLGPVLQIHLGIGGYAGATLVSIGLISTIISMAAYYGPITCSNCHAKMKKFRCPNVDPGFVRCYVYVCNPCKKFFKRSVKYAA